MSEDTSSSRRFLPIGLDVRGMDCLIIGGGVVGARKAITLAGKGAKVTVVSPDVAPNLATEIDAGRVGWKEEEFRNEHLEGVFLVIAATDNEKLNADICRAAGDRGALVCDSSSADRSQVIFGALHDRGELTIAVFTDGRNPALSRKMRDRIAALLDKDNKKGIQQ
ncbi:MAG: precorrin-2 dehydrogenase/sirohydrochlorin ferrochelatase family protein [Planctomycetota bacterium]|jgi:siroheme synthase-like protein